ncbi:MAG: PHP domain-containing protein [Spirochaetota bacterium]
MPYTIDLHTHSVASNHAYSTIQEMAAQAAKNGISTFALTDHGPALPGGPHIYHFANMRILPSHIDGVEILKGIEANIVSVDGALDVEERRLKALDIVLAGFHHGTGYDPSNDVSDNTSAAVSAISSGLVDVLCHPGNPDYPIDFITVIEAAVKHDVALEFNNSSFRMSRRGSADNCRQLLKLAKDAGVFISLGSDAHISFDVGRNDVVEEMVLRIGYPEHLVLNSSRSVLAKFLQKRHT